MGDPWPAWEQTAREAPERRLNSPLWELESRMQHQLEAFATVCRSKILQKLTRIILSVCREGEWEEVTATARARLAARVSSLPAGYITIFAACLS